MGYLGFCFVCLFFNLLQKIKVLYRPTEILKSPVLCVHRFLSVNKMNNMSPEVALHRITPELRPLLCSVVRNGRVGLDSTNCLRVTDLKTGWSTFFYQFLCLNQIPSVSDHSSCIYLTLGVHFTFHYHIFPLTRCVY